MPHELINVTPHPKGEGFIIPFNNGSVDIPNAPGGYCISSGCGSGKTEACKSIIRNKFKAGVLYAVDTISECLKMYQWVQDELVTPGIIKDTDVMMVNSQATLESMKTYQDHPEKICDKLILIVVQVRLFIELINYFLIFKPKTPPVAFDGDFRILMARQDLRKWIIFDETPLFLKPFVSMTRGELSPYVEYNTHTGKWCCKSLPDIQKTYSSYIKGDPKMDYNRKDNAMCRVKNKVILNMIPRMFSTWMSQKGKEYRVQFWPSDLVQPQMTPHVLVFEGAGDILIGSKSKFILNDFTPKYNSNLVFHPFSFGLNRKKEPDAPEYANFVTSILNILHNCPGKTLIVIWKDFKAKAISEIANDKYTSMLKDALVSAGVPDTTFAVTYYGASDTKSCNTYRDYENIILAGRWGLGLSVIDKLKRAFLVQDTCMENYMMWYYVQLILRIGARNNNGGTYHVYYSGDHKDTFIYRLSVYLNQNILIPKAIPANAPLWEIMVKQFKKGSYYLPDIRKLVQRDPRIKDAIEASLPYTTSITLKDIDVLIPKKKKRQRENYKSLKAFLVNVHIILNIT